MKRKITVKCFLYNTTNEHEQDIDSLMHTFVRAEMTAFNRLTKTTKINSSGEATPDNLKFLTKSEIEKLIQSKYKFNSREAKDVIEEARQLLESQKALIKDYSENLKSKIKVIENKLKKDNLKPLTRLGLESKLKKRQDKLSFYQEHIKNETIPPVIFGKKKNFKDRKNGNIERQTFLENKYNRYVSRGDATKGGNPHLRVVLDKNGNTYLSIPKPEKIQSGKKMLLQRFETPLYIPQKLSKKTGVVNGINYRKLLLSFIETGKAYKVELIRKNGKYYAHITFDVEYPENKATTNFGIMGIDTNPDGLALTIISRDGNYKFHIYLKCSELMCARTNRRTNLAGELASKAVKIALQYGVAIAVEDLKFQQNKDSSKKFNRVRHNFAYRQLLNSIEGACARHGVELIKVKPMYTSKIGLYKYCHQYGMDIHNGAGMVIARRAYGYKERVPKYLVKRCVRESDYDKFYRKSEYARYGQIDAVVKKVVEKNDSINKKIKNKPNGYIQYRKQFLNIAI